MIIRKCDDYFLIKIFNNYVENFNLFDISDIKKIFQIIFNKLKKKYDINGLIDADVYVDQNYGMIMEIKPICDYFDEIDIRIKIHLNNLFLINIDTNTILDYEEVYYYKGKFYGTYCGICDNEIIYKNTEDIINKGIRVC